MTVDELGNTSSTTLFVALWKYLNEGRFAPGDRVMLLALASGLEVGIVIFRLGQLVEPMGTIIEAAATATESSLGAVQLAAPPPAFA